MRGPRCAHTCRYNAAQRVVTWMQPFSGVWLRTYIPEPYPKILGRLEEARVDYATVRDHGPPRLW